MRISTENTGRSKLLMYTILLMVACLFISRAALSISMILFLGSTLIHNHIVNQLKCFLKDPVLISMSLLFIIPFISGIWSNDTSSWLDVMRIKIPLLLFPIAFAGNWKLTRNQWKTIAYFIEFILIAGACWSLGNYLQNPFVFHEAYLKAKTINTPLENDHVRFSWLVAVGIISCFLLIESTVIKWIKICLILTILFLSIYLHILSARTGLFSLYIFLFLYAIRLIIKNRRPVISILILSGLVILPLLSWLFLPTFQNRLKYFRYDLSFVRSNSYLPGSDDGARMISIRAGWYIIKTHPFGAGAGDIKNEMEQWYPSHVPGMLITDKFYPCSEWIMYGCFAGWPGMILFSAIMLVPLFFKTKTNHFYWIAINCIAAFSFVFDIGLENQFGAFIYSFTILWWYKWLNQKKEINNG